VPDAEPISPTPPDDEEERAIWAIRKVVKATTGMTISVEEATSLFNIAKARLAEQTPESAP